MRLPLRTYVLSFAFFSGFSALLYQLVWIYHVNLVLGVSAYAVALVIAVFFVGLSLGSYFGGSLADQLGSQKGMLRIYALLEIGIALFALLVPFLLSAITPGLAYFYAATPSLFWFLRLLATILVLLIPSIGIGITAPLLTRSYIGDEQTRAHTGFSVLYVCNTLGGAVGVLLTGIVLLKYIGTTHTLLLGAIINGILALVAYHRSLQYSDVRVVTPRTTTPARRISHLSLLLFLSGLLALSYEVLWTRLFSLYYLGTIYATTLMLGVLLIGIVIGGMVFAWYPAFRKKPLYYVALMHICVLATASCGLVVFTRVIAQTSSGADSSLTALMLAASILLLLPSIFLGISFVILGALVTTTHRGMGKGIGRSYAYNTLGGLLGALITGFYVLPTFGLRNAFVVLILVGMGVGVYCLTLRSKALTPLFTVCIAGLCMVLLVLSMVTPTFIALQPGATIQYQGHGPTGTISVITAQSGEREGVTFSRLFVDNQLVAADTPVLALDSKILAHLPLLLHKNPKRVATVGLGSGGTSYSMLLHPTIETVDAIEIEPRVVTAASYFETLNNGLMHQNEPRFTVIVDDARAYFTLTDLHYDVIVTDVTNLKYKRNSNLYTQDYFALLRDHTAQGGIVAAWVPAAGITESEQKILMQTFSSVFDEMYVWYPYHKLSHFFVYIGVSEPLRIPYGTYMSRATQNPVAADMARVDLTPENMLVGMLLDTNGVHEYVDDSSIHTDTLPILSYPSYSEQAFGENIGPVFARAQSIIPYIFGGSEQALGALLYEQAGVREPLLIGHSAFLAGDTQTAAEAYSVAIENAGYLETIDIG